jgi:hypothetical protein
MFARRSATRLSACTMSRVVQDGRHRASFMGDRPNRAISHVGLMGTRPTVYVAVTESRTRRWATAGSRSSRTTQRFCAKWLHRGGAWLSTAASIAAATGAHIEAIRPACSLCSAAIASSGWFFRRHQLLPGAPMNPWRSIGGRTGQCWP